MALTIGLAPTIIRNSIWNSLYYGTVHEIEKRIQPLENGFLEAGRWVDGSSWGWVGGSSWRMDVG